MPFDKVIRDSYNRPTSLAQWSWGHNLPQAGTGLHRATIPNQHLQSSRACRSQQPTHLVAAIVPEASA